MQTRPVPGRSGNAGGESAGATSRGIDGYNPVRTSPGATTFDAQFDLTHEDLGSPLRTLTSHGSAQSVSAGALTLRVGIGRASRTASACR